MDPSFNIKALQKLLNRVVVPKINEIFSLVNIKDEITISVDPDYDYSVYYLSNGERQKMDIYTITVHTKNKYNSRSLLGVIGDMILSTSRYVLTGNFVLQTRFTHYNQQGSIPSINLYSSVESNPFSNNVEHLINDLKYFKKQWYQINKMFQPFKSYWINF